MIMSGMFTSLEIVYIGRSAYNALVTEAVAH
jgi:hypothetical protein